MTMNECYAAVELRCALGAALLVAGRDGLQWLALGDDPSGLWAEWPTRHPRIRWLDRGPPESWIEAVQACLDDELPHDRPLPPLAPAGTAFQHRVWAGLRALPRGVTISYQALAARLGQPTAARAVARACAANPLAVLIPCHRVVGSDGSLSGYRWGLARKRALLQREGALPA
ncbi:MAG: methylated-DNA--[protein]-cysteine S-methyltransferase [Tepidimonas sp.]|nr:methylated-DNA--[protein]-cysteine S-methyltransferase [Tepidimonas sp.]